MRHTPFAHVKRSTRVSGLSLALVVVACAPLAPTDSAPVASVLPPGTVAPRGFRPADSSLLRRALRQEGALTFRAWDGKVTTAGHDIDLTLLADGSVRAVECDYGCGHSRGQIELDGRFGMRMRFDPDRYHAYPFGKWRFALGWLGGDLVLCRWDAPRAIPSTASSTRIDCDSSYLPFRQLLGASAARAQKCAADTTCASPYVESDYPKR